MKAKFLSLTILIAISSVLNGCTNEGSNRIHVKSNPDIELDSYVASLKGGVFKCRFKSPDFPTGLFAVDKDEVTIHLRNAENKKIAQRSFGINTENPNDDHVDKFVVKTFTPDFIKATHVYQVKGSSTEEKKGRIVVGFDLKKKSGYVLKFENDKPVGEAFRFGSCVELRAIPGLIKKPEKSDDDSENDKSADQNKKSGKKKNK